MKSVTHYHTINRCNGGAVVEIFEVDYAPDGTPSTGKRVASYETSSRGATKSARKHIDDLRADYVRDVIAKRREYKVDWD